MIKKDNEPYFSVINDNLKGDNPNAGEITVIDIEPSHFEGLKTYCPVCRKGLYWDRNIDCWICKACGNVIKEQHGESPLHGDLVLASSTDPFGGENKPFVKSFSSESVNDYENIREEENQVFRGSAEEALKADTEKLRREGKLR